MREITTGYLGCTACKVSYPILAGVAIVVPDVASYILNHVKGISKLVSDDDIPGDVLEDFVEAREEIEAEHIEEDLEADRVVSLYVMNHYLRVGDSKNLPAWAQSDTGAGSPLIQELIAKYWDHGPFAQIQKWVSEQKNAQPLSVVELGCGAGGLYPALRAKTQVSYLGVDSSFASIALARHLALGMPYGREIRIPGDLLQGPVSRPLGLAPVAEDLSGKGDFVVGEIEALPVEKGTADLTLALNAIDMMPEPEQLPKLQYELLKEGGTAIQSCPYIWHEQVARELREKLPKYVTDSAQAVEWLYERAGLKIEARVEHLPWLFFKHLRQLEIYSVHAFRAKKA